MVPLALAASLLLSAAAASPAAATARPSGAAKPSASGSPSPAASASASASAPAEPAPIILFLIDNSASLPPLDPQEKRVAALEKMFSFLQGQPYRLILFGGRNEVYVDDLERYRHNGQWTDYYVAFIKARELMQGYRAGTEVTLMSVIDAVVDP